MLENLYALLNLNVRTLVAVLFWGNLTSVVLIFSYQLSCRHTTDRSLTNFYGLAKLFQALSYFFLFNRETLPDILSVNLGNSIFFIGLYFESFALLRIIQGNLRRLLHLLTIILLVSLFVFNAVEFYFPDPSTRVVMASAIIISLIIIPNTKLLLMRRISAFKRIIGLFYLFLIILLIPRIYHALTTPIDIHSNFLSQSLTLLALVMIMIFSLPSYLLLMKEKSDQIISLMATTDFLTGLQNRYSFLDAANAVFERSQADGHPVSLFFLDIDHFKKINDTYGHAFGDEVLIRIGKIIHRHLRLGDLSCRYGGEEFIVFLPNVDSDNAHTIGLRIMAEIRRTVFDEKPEFHFTTSMGLASAVPDASDTLDRYISRADEALYRAKEEGRNRIVEYDLKG